MKAEITLIPDRHKGNGIYFYASIEINGSEFITENIKTREQWEKDFKIKDK